MVLQNHFLKSMLTKELVARRWRRRACYKTCLIKLRYK